MKGKVFSSFKLLTQHPEMGTELKGMNSNRNEKENKNRKKGKKIKGLYFFFCVFPSFFFLLLFGNSLSFLPTKLALILRRKSLGGATNPQKNHSTMIKILFNFTFNG